MDDPVRAAVQQICDAEGSGWQVAHYVVCVGMERMESDDTIETAFWVVGLKDQPEYISDGLLDAAQRLRIEIAED